MIATLALGSLGNVSALAGGLLTRTVPVDLGRIASPTVERRLFHKYDGFYGRHPNEWVRRGPSSQRARGRGGLRDLRDRGAVHRRQGPRLRR